MLKTLTLNCFYSKKNYQNRFLDVLVSDLDSLHGLFSDCLGLCNDHSDGLARVIDVTGREDLLRGVEE